MKRKALKRAVVIVLALAILVSSVCLPSFAEDVDEDLTAETIPEEQLNAMIMADRFVFTLPEENTDLLDAPMQFKGIFSSLTNQTRMQVVYNEGGRIDALDTAYLSYKITNNSSEVLSIGTMVYFRTTGGNLCAYVLKPLVYDAKTGKKLDLTSSYEYTSGKFVLTDVMPTVEIPANSVVYMAIPFVSVGDQSNYVPG